VALFDATEDRSGVEVEDDEVKGLIGALATVRRNLGLAKIKMIKDFVDDLLETQQKVVIFAYHRQVVDELHKAYHNIGVKLYGGMNKGDRQLAIDTFQKDPDCRVFVGNIMAAGVGIRLDSADVVVFAELSWLPSDMKQAEERIWSMDKAEATTPVDQTVYHLTVENTLDAAMSQILINRADDIHASTNIDALVAAALIAVDDA
jgi:SWI/SNF-related matrix-associated actin-dependent regulator 1 of chromatin subfamily A